jgi:hypothetical protein
MLLDGGYFSYWQHDMPVAEAESSVETTSSWEESLEACSADSGNEGLFEQIGTPCLALRKFCDFYEDYESESDRFECTTNRADNQDDGNEQTSFGTDDLTPKQVNHAFFHEESTAVPVERSKEAFFPTEISNITKSSLSTVTGSVKAFPPI